MKTVFDYLNYYNDVSFDEYSFNDMDNVIFSTLAYLPLNVSNKESFGVLEALEVIKDEKKSRSIKFVAIQLLEIISKGKRYKDMVFSNFVSVVDDKTQFGAITIRFGKIYCYVAFKGTDNSLIGWKENLELSYKYPVEAQVLASHYLKNTIRFSDKVIYVGGHSKGGNLAMASVMEIDKGIYNRIKYVYNNDGPGFRKEEFDSLGYKRMASKLKFFIPEESMVGILLFSDENPYIVKSNERGVMQHYPTNWNCFGGFLVKGKLSKYSAKMKEQFKAFLEKTDDKNKELMVNTLFDILEENGIKYFNQIKNMNLTQISSMIKDAQGIDNESKEILTEVLKSLLFNDKK